MHGTYMCIICVFEMATILNMATKEASGDVENSQFEFTTVKNIMKNTKTTQIRPVDPMHWET